MKKIPENASGIFFCALLTPAAHPGPHDLRGRGTHDPAPPSATDKPLLPDRMFFRFGFFFGFA